MRLTGFDATWLILIEDDAVLTDDFRERAAQALAAAPPDSIVSFYLGTGPWAGMGNAMREHLLPAIIEEGRTTGWVKSDRLFNAVAFAMPMMLAPLVRYYMSASDYPTDTAIGQWTLMMHVPVWYTFPPLVDHADGYSYVDGCEPIITRKALS